MQKRAYKIIVVAKGKEITSFHDDEIIKQLINEKSKSYEVISIRRLPHVLIPKKVTEMNTQEIKNALDDIYGLVGELKAQMETIT